MGVGCAEVRSAPGQHPQPLPPGQLGAPVRERPPHRVAANDWLVVFDIHLYICLLNTYMYYLHIHVYICICMLHVYVHIYICTYVLCVCMYVNTYINVYIYFLAMLRLHRWVGGVQ